MHREFLQVPHSNRGTKILWSGFVLAYVWSSDHSQDFFWKLHFLIFFFKKIGSSTLLICPHKHSCKKMIPRCISIAWRQYAKLADRLPVAMKPRWYRCIYCAILELADHNQRYRYTNLYFEFDSQAAVLWKQTYIRFVHACVLRAHAQW